MCLKCNKKIDSIKKNCYEDIVRSCIQIPKIRVLRKGNSMLSHFFILYYVSVQNQVLKVPPKIISGLWLMLHFIKVALRL